MKHHKIEQNTEDWMNLRMGKFTASSFKDLFMKETTVGYQNAINKVVFERLTGEQPESFSNEWMERGHELEPLAVDAYEMQTFNDVEGGGFFETSDFIGASPDGLIGEDGLLEIKCPSYSVMISYLLTGKLPNIYKWQVYGQLFVSERKWCDFVAFHPNLPLFVLRIERDEKLISELKETLSNSVEKAKERIKIIKSL